MSFIFLKLLRPKYSYEVSTSDQYHHAHQTRPNSGGVTEGQPRFDKGGVAIFFYLLRVKNIPFQSFTLSD